MMFASTKEGADFHLSLLQHNPNISLDRYTLSRIRMCRSSIDKVEVIIVEVALGRPIMSNLLTVFLPTILLLVISYSTRLFAKDYIDMAIQVNLTILLVLATM